jgi:hypothetical protein
VPPKIRWRASARDTGGGRGVRSAAQHAESPAHRALSEIRAVDHIIVLRDGYPVQHGTHDELIAQEGPYRNIWEGVLRHSLDIGRDVQDSSEELRGASPEVRRSKFSAALEAANGDGRTPATSGFIPGRGSLGLQLSKIRRTDRVLVFEGKDAVQFGTHGELLVKEGPYRRLTGLLSRTERP